MPETPATIVLVIRLPPRRPDTGGETSDDSDGQCIVDFGPEARDDPAPCRSGSANTARVLVHASHTVAPSVSLFAHVPTDSVGSAPSTLPQQHLNMPPALATVQTEVVEGNGSTRSRQIPSLFSARPDLGTSLASIDAACNVFGRGGLQLWAREPSEARNSGWTKWGGLFRMGSSDDKPQRVESETDWDQLFDGNWQVSQCVIFFNFF